MRCLSKCYFLVLMFTVSRAELELEPKTCFRNALGKVGTNVFDACSASLQYETVTTDVNDLSKNMDDLTNRVSLMENDLTNRVSLLENDKKSVVLIRLDDETLGAGGFLYNTATPDAAFEDMRMKTLEYLAAKQTPYDDLAFSAVLPAPVNFKAEVFNDASLDSAFSAATQLDVLLDLEVTSLKPSLTLDNKEYVFHTFQGGLRWDEAWKGSNLVSRDGGASVLKRAGTGYGRVGASVRTTQSFTAGRHAWRLRLSTNELEYDYLRWINYGVIRSSVAIAEINNSNNSNYAGDSFSLSTYGSVYSTMETISGAGKKIQTTTYVVEVLLDCDTGTLAYRDEGADSAFLVIGVPTNSPLHPWVQVVDPDLENMVTIL